MDNDLNIIDVYLKNYGQMIILLLGMPTSNKSAIAKELESDIEPKFTLININNYLEKKFIDIEVRDIKFKLYDHPDNINYTKLLYDINQKKSSGVILYGNFIDPNKFKDIIIDFSYFFDLRHTYLKNNLIKKKILPFDDEVNNVSNIDIKNINVIKKNNHDTIEKSLITEKSSTINDSSNITSESNNTSTNSNDNTSSNSNDNNSSNSNDNNSKHKLNLKTDYEKKINGPNYEVICP
jgi:activator of HSP90 ATPase